MARLLVAALSGGYIAFDSEAAKRWEGSRREEVPPTRIGLDPGSGGVVRRPVVYRDGVFGEEIKARPAFTKRLPAWRPVLFRTGDGRWARGAELDGGDFVEYRWDGERSCGLWEDSPEGARQWFLA